MALPLALLLMATAQFLDYSTFLMMVARHGLEVELNPLVVLLVQKTGLLGLTLAKAGAVAFAGYSAMVIIRRRKTLAGVVLGFATGIGLIGAFSNVLSF